MFKSIIRYFTRTKDEKALKSLMKKFLKEGGSAIKIKHSGLCVYVSKEAKNHGGSPYSCPDLFKKLYQDWPLYSGHPLFPVQDKRETEIRMSDCYVGPMRARDQYLKMPAQKENYLWQGRQLELRKDLAQWVYNQL